MVSKKIVVTHICILLLLTGAFAFLGSQVSSLRIEVKALKEQINQMQPQALGIEIQRYECGNESLDMIVLVNDDDFEVEDYLGIAFDTNEDGKIANEGIGILYADNTTVAGILEPDGSIALPLMKPLPSPYHTCTFDSVLGYTFNVSLPLAMKRNLVYICFHDEQGNYAVHVQMEVVT